MFKGVVFTFSLRILTALVNLMLVVFISRYLGAYGKGETSIILISISFILLLNNFIGGSSLVYLSPRYQIGKLFLLSNCWSLFVFAVSYLFLVKTSFISIGIVSHIAIFSLITALIETNFALLLGKEKIVAYNIFNFLKSFINLILFWILFRYGFSQGIEAYLVSLYFALIVCLLVSSVYVFPFLKTGKDRTYYYLLNKLFKLGFINQIGQVFNFLSFRIIYYSLTYYSGYSELGVFTNSISIIESVLLITNSMVTVLFSKVSNSKNKITSQQIALKFIRYSILLSLSTIIAINILPVKIYESVFGSDFHDMKLLILYLSPGVFFYSIFLVIGHYYSGIGKFQPNTISSFAGLLCTGICMCLFTPNFTSESSGIIYSFSSITAALVSITFFTYQAKIKPTCLIPTIQDMKDISGKSINLFHSLLRKTTDIKTPK